MSYFAITQIHLNGERIDRVKLHQVELLGTNEFGLDEGTDTPASEVASMIKGADRVFVAVPGAPGEYVKADEVTCAEGSDDLLSVAIIGRSSTRLHELPRY
ncbi:hypothetical protein [Polaromonas sp.]|uniref:hypothetical protein n=1 Tax=Polaromonas sp. TaxID=1869339 RepID=UPI0032660395